MDRPEKNTTAEQQQKTHPYKKWFRVTVLSVALLIGGFVLGQAVGAGSPAAPGSEGDPLVTASWVEEKLEDVFSAIDGERQEKKDLEERLRKLEEEGVERPITGENDKEQLPAVPQYEVVRVPGGKTIYTGRGTEVIVRTGTVEAIEGEKGGISDVTAGRNLETGDTVERDHLVLSPREDGRGLKVESEAYVMIRGDYTLD